MFAYCGNSPVSRRDTTGHQGERITSETIQKILEGGGACGGAEVVIATAVTMASLPLISTGAYYIAEFCDAVITLFSRPLSHLDRVNKAEKEIQETVTKNSKIRYWSATVQPGYVDIGRPLTFRQAVYEVQHGRSVFAVTWFEARAVAREAGGTFGHNNKQLMPEIDSGKENTPGYYFHYHTYDRSGGHVYFLFGEVK